MLKTRPFSSVTETEVVLLHSRVTQLVRELREILPWRRCESAISNERVTRIFRSLCEGSLGAERVDPIFRLRKHGHSDVVPKAVAYPLADDRMLHRWMEGFRICEQSSAARETLQTQ